MKTWNALLYMLIFAFCAIGLNAAEVFQGHPRLLFRDSAWGPRAITTAMLAERVKDPRYKPYLDRMGRRGAQNLALRALLTGSREDARAAVERLLKREDYGNTTDAGLELMWDALAFDWLYNDSLFTEAEKQAVIKNLERGAETCYDLYMNQGSHIYHTRMYAYPAGVAIAGLALKGHHPKADFWIDWGRGIYDRDLFPALQRQDGSVHSSFAYGRKYTFWMVGQFISCWSSATGENLWDMIRASQGDWGWRQALFCIQGEQPDGKMVRFGDNFFRGTDRFSFRVIAERAHYYDEPAGRDYVNRLIARHTSAAESRYAEEIGSEYMVLLYWEPDAPARDYTTLPPRMMFSPEGTGMAFWRSGWGPDDTFVFFKCGDYFDNHGHFDAGHLEVFRRAPLLIEGGSYAEGTDTEHYKKFFHQSVAHNTINIADPSDPEDDGSHRFYNNQGQGTFAEYMANPQNDYGRIVDYRETENLAYIAADLSAAFPAGRVKQVLREVIWTGGRYVAVIDNISLADLKYVPRILWHYTVSPKLKGRSLKVEDGGARAVISVLAPSDAVIDTVQAFKVGTGIYPPAKPSAALGAGRAEVTVHGGGAGSYRFVQVIDIADSGVTPSTIKLVSDGENGIVLTGLDERKLVLKGVPGQRTEVRIGQ